MLNFVGSAVSATIPFYAFASFGESSGIAGLFYAAGGAGALTGSIARSPCSSRFAPLRLAGVSIVAMTLPLWVLPLGLPSWGVMAALFTMMFFAPLVNGPTIGLITARTPVELRAKVMTALIAVSTLATPLGFLAAGQPGSPAAGGGLRGRGGRDDGGGARLRRSRLPRRAGARRRSPCNPPTALPGGPRGSSMRLTAGSVEEPPKSITPAANTFAPCGVS